MKVKHPKMVHDDYIAIREVLAYSWDEVEKDYKQSNKKYPKHVFSSFIRVEMILDKYYNALRNYDMRKLKQHEVEMYAKKKLDSNSYAYKELMNKYNND